MKMPSKGLCYRYADPVRDANAYFTVAEVWLDTRPVCSDCGDPIQDEYFYNFEFDDVRLCQSCLYDRFSILDKDMFDQIEEDYKTNTEDWVTRNM